MPGLPDIGRGLIFLGVLLVIMGLLFMVGGNLSQRLGGIGRLPGDILIRRGNFTFYFPLATSLLVSLVLTAILWLLRRH